MGAFKKIQAAMFVLASTLLLASLGSAPADPVPSLRILGRYPLTPGGSPFTDIRWATNNSVFVMRTFHGLEEVQIAPEWKTLRQPVPSVWTLGGFDHMARLGVSDRYIFFSSRGQIVAWRPRDSRGPGFVMFRRKPIGLVEDVDLSGDRLLLLGAPSHSEPYAPGGGIAWLGTLGKDLEDWKPLLTAPDGADGEKAAALFSCGTMTLGGVRFLADGSMLVVPGVIPGAFQFDSQGQRIRSWNAQEIGINTDCRGMDRDFSERMVGSHPAKIRWPWMNQRHMLDDILPLPEGPGLLVRSVRADGKPTWELKVLKDQGGIDTYALPIVGNRSYQRLRGDVRNGRIALLLHSDFLPSVAKQDQEGELILAELPRARQQGE